MRGFTLIELLIAVVVIAVGMVFVSGALSSCLAVLTTASKTIEANYLLNQKIWEIDEEYYSEGGSQQGEWSQPYDAPDNSFSWVIKNGDITVDFDAQADIMKENFNEQKVKVVWQQGRYSKDISITRFVKKKTE